LHGLSICVADVFQTYRLERSQHGELTGKTSLGPDDLNVGVWLRLQYIKVEGGGDNDKTGLLVGHAGRVPCGRGKSGRRDGSRDPIARR